MQYFTFFYSFIIRIDQEDEYCCVKRIEFICVGYRIVIIKYEFQRQFSLSIPTLTGTTNTELCGPCSTSVTISAIAACMMIV